MLGRLNLGWGDVTLGRQGDGATQPTFFTRLCFSGIICKAFTFFIGNSRLNCQIIDSIFNMSLVYLHTWCTLVQSFMSRESAASKFCCLEFSFGYLKNLLLRISLSRIFKKSHEFFALNPTKNLSISQRHGKFASSNKGQISAKYVGNTFCTVLYLLRVANITLRLSGS